MFLLVSTSGPYFQGKAVPERWMTGSTGFVGWHWAEVACISHSPLGNTLWESAWPVVAPLSPWTRMLEPVKEINIPWKLEANNRRPIYNYASWNHNRKYTLVYNIALAFWYMKPPLYGKASDIPNQLQLAFWKSRVLVFRLAFRFKNLVIEISDS